MAIKVLYKKIYEDLLLEIQNGKYTVGSRLPSEMELAETYGVSRITSKKALEMLADRGIVFRQPGKGTFVSSEQLGRADASISEEEGKADDPSGQKQVIIGVIFDSFDISFGAEILRGLEYECRRRNMLMMLRLTYGSMETEKKALSDMRAAGVSGIVLMCTQNKSYNADVLKLYLDQFALVLVDREMKGIPIPVVTTDNYRASRELTSRLIRDGHRKIGYVSHSHVDTSTIAARFEGFCDALRGEGLWANGADLLRNMDAYIPQDDDMESNIPLYKKELSDFIDSHPDVTAYYAVEFSIAQLLYMVLEEKGLEKEKALVYFDGFRSGPSPLSRNCLHIMQDQYQMGVAAIRNLAHILRGEQVSEYEFIPYIFIEPETGRQAP